MPRSSPLHAPACIAGTEPSARAAVRRACAGAVPIALAAARGGAPGRPRVWLVVGAQAGRTCPPVKPWQMTFVSAKMAGKGRPSLVPNDRIGAAARQRCEARMVLRLASAMLVFLGVCDVPPSQVLGQKPHDFWQQIKRPSAWIKCAQGQYCRLQRGSLGFINTLPLALSTHIETARAPGPELSRAVFIGAAVSLGRLEFFWLASVQRSERESLRRRAWLRAELVGEQRLEREREWTETG
jgi:hypothetical protein